jgi:hypothetical protein
MKIKELTSNTDIDDETVLTLAKKIMNAIPSAKKIDGLGFCAIMTYELWEQLKKPKDYGPYSVFYGENEHVILYNVKLNKALDVTGKQFNLPIINNDPKKYFNDFYRLSVNEIKDMRHYG